MGFKKYITVWGWSDVCLFMIISRGRGGRGVGVKLRTVRNVKKN